MQLLVTSFQFLFTPIVVNMVFFLPFTFSWVVVNC